MLSSADFQKITVLLFDIDGTLTDGSYSLTADGAEKRFNIRDQHWLKLARRAGLKTGVISGWDCPANHRFAEIVSLDYPLFGVKDKSDALEELMKTENLQPEEILYAGDDVVDLPVIRRVGIGVAVADAVPELDEYAKWRTCAAGGKGAAYEIIRRVLEEKNLLNDIMERYRR